MANGDTPSYSLRWQATPASCGNCGKPAGWGVVGAREIYHQLEPLCDNCTLKLAPELSKALIAIQVMREAGEMVVAGTCQADQVAMLLTLAKRLHQSCRWPLRMRFIEGAIDLGDLIRGEDGPIH